MPNLNLPLLDTVLITNKLRLADVTPLDNNLIGVNAYRKDELLDLIYTGIEFKTDAIILFNPMIVTTEGIQHLIKL